MPPSSFPPSPDTGCSHGQTTLKGPQMGSSQEVPPSPPFAQKVDPPPKGSPSIAALFRKSGSCRTASLVTVLPPATTICRRCLVLIPTRSPSTTTLFAAGDSFLISRTCSENQPRLSVTVSSSSSKTGCPTCGEPMCTRHSLGTSARWPFLPAKHHFCQCHQGRSNHQLRKNIFLLWPSTTGAGR